MGYVVAYITSLYMFLLCITVFQNEISLNLALNKWLRAYISLKKVVFTRGLSLVKISMLIKFMPEGLHHLDAKLYSFKFIDIIIF